MKLKAVLCGVLQLLLLLSLAAAARRRPPSLLGRLASHRTDGRPLHQSPAPLSGYQYNTYYFTQQVSARLELSRTQRACSLGMQQPAGLTRDSCSYTEPGLLLGG